MDSAHSEFNLNNLNLSNQISNPTKKSGQEIKQNDAASQLFESTMRNINEDTDELEKGHVSSGTVDTYLSSKIVKKLNESSTASISFNEMKVEEELDGGACTTVSLIFIKNYLSKMKDLYTQKEGAVTPEDIIEAIRDLAVDNQMDKPQGSSDEVIRSIQMALNTIEVRSLESPDSKSSKVQSLLGVQNLSATNRSSSFHIQRESSGNVDIASKKQDFKEEINNLPKGVYFLRGIVPIDKSKISNKETKRLQNSAHAKLEKYGHSTVFIKSNDCAFFFDPNIGAIFIPKGKEVDQLKEMILDQHSDFDLKLFRFYKVEEQGPMSPEKLLVLMNYKNIFTEKDVNAMPEDMAKALQSKFIKKIVNMKKENIPEITKLSAESINKINVSPTLRSLINKGNNLKFDDIIKISQLPDEMAKGIEINYFIAQLDSGNFSVENYQKTYNEVKAVLSNITKDRTLNEDPKLISSLSALIIGEKIKLEDLTKTYTYEQEKTRGNPDPKPKELELNEDCLSTLQYTGTDMFFHSNDPTPMTFQTFIEITA
ncbi:MAG: hypothetical protein H0U49_07660 [Parachlamydiaceae bacterium]|nr:hypothetical protein [Parachlamydiaceae bacterium]